ncbi:Hypothetical predicted protein [Octopus vulgaris]|uniref:Uncharacterized protein n=1 Tax=Octopus vulgaris TaxID=6645 RepID=A0AA36BK05_OCTVU|nr:Hypothetical predicted protein [Octopus vulgaris]
MAPTWEKKELDRLLRAWTIASGDPPNSIITAALKNNGFPRTIDQIERKKGEFIRSYMLIRPHIKTLDNIIENYCGKVDGDEEDEKEKEAGCLCYPGVPQENGSPTSVNDEVQAPKKSSSNQDKITFAAVTLNSFVIILLKHNNSSSRTLDMRNRNEVFHT